MLYCKNFYRDFYCYIADFVPQNNQNYDNNFQTLKKTSVYKIALKTRVIIND